MWFIAQGQFGFRIEYEKEMVNHVERFMIYNNCKKILEQNEQIISLMALRTRKKTRKRN